MSREQRGKGLRICLTGGWFSSDNVGDNAILAGIRDSFPADTRFTAFSSAPDHVRAKHNIASFAPKQDPFKLYAELRAADALLFTGGTPFYDDLPHMSYFAALAASARFHRVPIVVFGIAIRTLDSGPSRALARFIGRAATYVGGREDRTVRMLGELLGQGERVRLLPDPAIRMTPISPHEAERELTAIGLPTGSRRVGICMRDFTSPAKFHAAHYSNRYNLSQVDTLMRTVADVCERVVGYHGAEVVFLPMNTKAPDDDRNPARQVRDAIAPHVRPHVHVIEKQYGPREMKGLLGRMDAVLGIRFHSLVLSSSMGVPAFAIEYAPKNSAIMRFFGRGDHVQIIGHLDAADMIGKLDGMLSDPAPQRAALAARLREITDLYETECRAIIEAIQQHKSSRSGHL